MKGKERVEGGSGCFLRKGLSEKDSLSSLLSVTSAERGGRAGYVYRTGVSGSLNELSNVLR